MHEALSAEYIGTPNLNLNLKTFIRQKMTIWNKVTEKYITECYILGDPYKGDEHTAGIRATHRYYNAWTDTMSMKCFSFGIITWEYVDQRKKYFMNRAPSRHTQAQNLHSYSEGQTNTKKCKKDWLMSASDLTLHGDIMLKPFYDKDELILIYCEVEFDQ